MMAKANAAGRKIRPMWQGEKLTTEIKRIFYASKHQVPLTQMDATREPS